MDGMKLEPDSDSNNEPVSALCETELVDVKEEDSPSASASDILVVMNEDIKAKSVKGTKAKVRSGGARGEQQECGYDIETHYIKEEADNEVAAAEPGAHIEDTREFSSLVFANPYSDEDDALCSGKNMGTSVNHGSEQCGHVTSDSVEARDDSDSVSADTYPSPVTLPFISDDDERGLIGHFSDLPHICYVCNKGFGNRVNLRRHYRVHTEYRRYDCKDCDKSYRHLIDLKRHALIHTGKQPYSCDICSKSFSRITHLRDHTLTHTGERPHVCKVCSKTFSQASNLQTHQLTHTGERPHVCPVCGKCFSQRANLQTHSVLHSGTRPFGCKICGKGFHRRRDLQNHCVTHTGERPHVCPVCNKAFALLDNLRKHSDLHSGKRPHECKQCGKAFTKKYDLNRHTRRHIEETK